MGSWVPKSLSTSSLVDVPICFVGKLLSPWVCWLVKNHNGSDCGELIYVHVLAAPSPVRDWTQATAGKAPNPNLWVARELP